VFGELPKDAVILKSMQLVAERLEHIEWEVELKDKNKNTNTKG